MKFHLFKAILALSLLGKVAFGATIFNDQVLINKTLWNEKKDPTSFYLPDEAGTFPTIIFLQGGKVDAKHYSNLATSLADKGFIVAVPQHTGLLGESFTEQYVFNKVWEYTKKKSEDKNSPLWNKVDTDKVVIMGHSFGSAVAMNIAEGKCGAPGCIGKLDTPKELKAAILFGFHKNIPLINIEFENNVPVLIIQGGLDDYKASRKSFHNIKNGPKFHIKMYGTNHYGICNENNPEGAKKDKAQPEVDQETSVEAAATWSARFLEGFVNLDLNAQNYFTKKMSKADPLVSVEGTFVKNIENKVESISINKPAFTYLIKLPGKEESSLFVTSFGKDTEDKIYYFPKAKDLLDPSKDHTPRVLMEDIVWPNQIKLFSQQIDNKHLMVAAGGFFAPPFNGHRTGAITLHSFPEGKIEEGKSHVITNFDKGWFYHKVHFSDVNKDGRMDIITAKTNWNPLLQVFNPILISPLKAKSELVWLEQPKDGALNKKWKAHTIFEGPDLAFEMYDIDNDGQAEIIATESFKKRLRCYWFENNKWLGRTVRNDLGMLFGFEIKDLNGDGKKDLLVTNHENDHNAAVFALEIPKNFKNEPWPFHTLHKGFVTRMEGKGQASPGGAQAFYPSTMQRGDKPYIIVSGDGSRRVHLLKPKSNQADDWRYEESYILETERSVTGEISLGDPNYDGWIEVFVPVYDENRIEILHSKKF